MEKKVIVKLQSLLQEHNMSSRELSRLTDVPRSTIRKLIRQEIQNIHLNHISRICAFFGINDIREIIDLVDISTESL
ncbi:helix-turn-helix domain-containing protein [Bacillus salipaludis]|uniref:Helix-turn-helix transcriptional regulator n=1 Tax=Bacillus salipaludis TaxID=2547811 RepID=A0AA90TVB4_9BACI|nr:helix-turn-helix transcriptional regulator [Bacillus salipaludis]MDQ6594973.1 helix-turn-helix transcriptional regulator [Bacillus salipaludis]